MREAARIIIEHSNAELERRRKVEARLRKVAAAICEIKARCPGNAEVWSIAWRALNALEGGDA